MNWNEKYRARKIDEIYGQEHVNAVMNPISKKIRESGDDADMPHFLYYGPPGTGKTNMVHAFLNETFGDVYKDDMREFNASDMKVDKLRTTVMDLCRSEPTGEFQKADGTWVPMKLRFIFFDEVDRLTDKSQGILRRLIEKHAKDVRWFFSCNDVYKVLDAIRDRCTEFRFRRVRDDCIKIALKKIMIEHNISMNEDAMDIIISRSSGSVRRAQNTLFKAFMVKKHIDEETVLLVSDANKNEIYMKIFAEMVANPTQDTYVESKNKVYSLLKEGFTVNEIIINIFEGMDEDERVPVNIKMKYLPMLSDLYYKSYFVDRPDIMLIGWLRGLK